MLEKDPGNPAALYWLARVLRLQGEKEGNPRLLEEAHGLFERALELSPSMYDAFHMATWCLIQLGRFTQAEKALHTWTREHAPGAKTLELYGYLYGTRASGGRANPLFDPKKAFSWFDRSLAMNGNNPFLLKRLIVLAKRCGLPVYAEEYAARLARIENEGWR